MIVLELTILYTIYSPSSIYLSSKSRTLQYPFVMLDLATGPVAVELWVHFEKVGRDCHELNWRRQPMDHNRFHRQVGILQS